MPKRPVMDDNDIERIAREMHANQEHLTRDTLRARTQAAAARVGPILRRLEKEWMSEKPAPEDMAVPASQDDLLAAIPDPARGLLRGLIRAIPAAVEDARRTEADRGARAFDDAKATYVAEIEKVRADLAAAQESIEVAALEAATAEREIADARADAEAARGELTGALADLRAERERVEDARRETAAVRQEVAAVQRDAEEAARQLGDNMHTAWAEAADLRAELVRVQTQAEEQRAASDRAVAHLMESLKGAQADFAAARSAAKHLEAEVQRLTSERDRAVAEAAELRGRVTAMEGAAAGWTRISKQLDLLVPASTATPSPSARRSRRRGE